MEPEVSNQVKLEPDANVTLPWLSGKQVNDAVEPPALHWLTLAVHGVCETRASHVGVPTTLRSPRTHSRVIEPVVGSTESPTTTVTPEPIVAGTESGVQVALPTVQPLLEKLAVLQLVAALLAQLGEPLIDNVPFEQL